MYGLINSALQDMIVTHFGETTWNQVHERSGVDVDTFLTMRQYDDEITYQLAGAASEVLGKPVEACLELFGRHWVEAVATRNFATLMDTTGSTTVDFLHNLNALHDRITSTFVDYVPPEFRVKMVDAENGRYQVLYDSTRKGLSPFVTGLLYGLAEHFGDELTINDFTVDESGDGTHTVYELVLK